MSTRDCEASGPLKYAPKRARTTEREAPPGEADSGVSEPSKANAQPPEPEPAAEPSPEPIPSERKPRPAPSRPQESAPPWKLKGRPGTFEGDLAIKELRERMTLTPDCPPEPPIRNNRGAMLGMVGRRAGLVALATVAAYGFVSGNQLEVAFAGAQNALLAISQLCPSVSLVVPGQPPAHRPFWCPRPHTIRLVLPPQSSVEAAKVTGGKRASTTVGEAYPFRSRRLHILAK